MRKQEHFRSRWTVGTCGCVGVFILQRLEKTVFSLQVSNLQISISKQHFRVFLNETHLQHLTEIKQHYHLFTHYYFHSPQKEYTCTKNWSRFSRKAPHTENTGCADCDYHVHMGQSLFSQNGFNTVTHSLTGTISMGEKHGGEANTVAHSLLHTCICNGTIKMQHPKIFGWRHTQVLMLQCTEIDSQQLANVISVNHYPTIRCTAQHQPFPSSSSKLLCFVIIFHHWHSQVQLLHCRW